MRVPLKVLIELRPAFEGHAGIPQETRLLFCGIAQLDGVEAQGLIQTGDRFLAPGLSVPPDASAPTLASDEVIDRMSRVVVSTQAPESPRPMPWPLRAAMRLLRPIGRLAPLVALTVRSLVGLREPLSWFDPRHFPDFVWRSLFAKTLPLEDREQVIGARFRIARAPYGGMHAVGLFSRSLGRAVYPRLDTGGIDAMLAMTPYPAGVSEGTRLIVRYFDAVPLLMPHTIRHKAHHQALHYQALRHNVARGAWFVCCSEASRLDLLKVFPSVTDRAVTIPCMLSHDYFPEASSARRVPEVLARRALRAVPGAPLAEDAARRLVEAVDLPQPADYLLMVSTLEPRKNHETLVEAWEQLRSADRPGLKLVVVGSMGWDHDAIIERMRIWIERGEILVLSGVPADELRLLYRHACVTVCPSYAEGFGYAGVEAMRCGGVVAASDIAVHREIYGDAAEYFSPYSASEIAQAVLRVIGPDRHAHRLQLAQRGEQVCARYLPDKILPMWRDLLQRAR